MTKKVAHKAAEATGEVLGNKIADKTVKPKPTTNVNWRSVEEMIISPEKRAWSEQIKTSIIIWKTTKYLNH